VHAALATGATVTNLPIPLTLTDNNLDNFPLMVDTTTSGSFNITAIGLVRGDYANGYAQLRYGTFQNGAVSNEWSVGLRAGDNNYGIWDEINQVRALTVVSNTDQILILNLTVGSVAGNGGNLTNTGTSLASIPTPFSLLNSNQTAALVSTYGGSGSVTASQLTAGTNAVLAALAATNTALLNTIATGNTNQFPISYAAISPNATNLLTCNFSDLKEFTTLTIATNYFFTVTNIPASGAYKSLGLFIYNTVSATNCGVSFPASWVWIGVPPSAIWPTNSAYLQLEAFGTNIIATWGAQY
jgi:hypothetical protein